MLIRYNVISCTFPLTTEQLRHMDNYTVCLIQQNSYYIECYILQHNESTRCVIEPAITAQPVAASADVADVTGVSDNPTSRQHSHL